MHLNILDYIIHIDVYLNTIVSNYGFWTYLALFAVIFCETGLVVTPFLPGDSLLFAAGSIAAQPGNPLHILILFLLLFCASVFGNQINFLIGRLLGPRIFRLKNLGSLIKNTYKKRIHFMKNMVEKRLFSRVFYLLYVPLLLLWRELGQ